MENKKVALTYNNTSKNFNLELKKINSQNKIKS